MEREETNLRPKAKSDKWDIFSDTNPYQNMTESQRMVFDHAEENGMRGAKRYTKEDIAKWQEKRANMTEEEIAAMEAEIERKGTKMGKGFLIGVAVLFVLAIIGCIVAVQHPELTDLAHWNR